MPIKLRSVLILLLVSSSPVVALDAGAYLAAQVAAAHSDFRSADPWYKTALDADPGNPALLEGALIAALSLGDVSRAAQLAQDLQKQGVTSQNVALARLVDHAMRADFKAILADQSKGLSVGPLMDDLATAWANVGLGKMSDALAQFDKIIATPGMQPFGLYHKALALAQAGDFGGADDILSGRVAGRLTLTKHGLIAHAKILSQLEKAPMAVQMLEQNLGADPEIADLLVQLRAGKALPLTGLMTAQDGMAESLLTLASALEQQNDIAVALLNARAALALRPQDSESILLTAGLLIDVKQPDSAASVYAMIPKTDPAFRNAEIGRASAEFDAGRDEAAVKILVDLAAAYPKDADVLLILGNGQRRVQSYAAAVAAYDAAIALMPKPNANQWPVYFGRGISQQELGDFDQAESDMRQALKLYPDQADVLNYLGYSLVDRGRNLDEALDMINRAVAQRPDSGFIIDSLAWAYFRLGRYGDALAPMEKASLLEPVDPILTDHLGDVYWANGRKREAEYQWRRALSYAPSDKDAARIQQKLDRGLDAVMADEGTPLTPAK